MIINKMNTKEIYQEIIKSDLCYLAGPRIDLEQMTLDLCAAIKAEKETDWYIGEGETFSLSDYIIGAFWAFSQWHAGQNSQSYAALCALGSIFNPAFCDGPEPDSSEEIAFEAINCWFEESQEYK